MRYDAPKHLFVNIIYLYKLDVAVESRAISGYSTTSISYERKGRPGNIYMLLRDIPRLTCSPWIPDKSQDFLGYIIPSAFLGLRCVHAS